MDKNIVYEFHLYQPFKYTHQLFDWANLGDEGKYPDSELKHYINETPGYDNSQELTYPRDKSYLKATLERYITWAKLKQVPLYMGEFGTGSPTFKDNKGGLIWVKDVLDIINQHQLSYSYHAYHEDAYGIYFGNDHLPDPKSTNEMLIELFRKQTLK